MRISTFFYTLRQGIVSIFKNKWFTLASIATISACLFVFGISYVLIFNVDHLVNEAEQSVSITVFFDEGLPQEEIQKIGYLLDDMKMRGIVSKYDFVSADQAWEEFSAKLGENAEGFTENPLKDSANYQIYLTDISKQAEVVEYLEGLEGVRKVNRSEITASTFSAAGMIITYVSIGMIALLLAVSVFLISNTVTIGISVRKEEITVMKYVGATDFFVRAPFVIEGIVIGFIGSALPLAAVYYLYVLAQDFLAQKMAFLTNIFTTVPVETVFTTLIPISLAIGVGIGFLGSFFTVRKHLRV